MTTFTLEFSDVPSWSTTPVAARPDPSILQRNLAALARSSARTAELVRFCAPRTDLRFLQTEDGVAAVEVIDPSGREPARAIASRRRPIREGEQLADTVDVASAATVAVMGFGAGYHVRAIAKRMSRTGVVAVFEPDVALLRAVFERIDHSEWLAASNTAIFTDPDNAAEISSSLTGAEGIVMIGVALFEHAPSAARLGESRTRFYKNLQDVIAAIRTSVATTMVQGKVTVANLTQNLGWYVSADGVSQLAGTNRGTPAIVVSAGPSLQRNIEQLSRPGVRDRFTIIAAQTVLKPLLARGIKPHYVVALDHSEISARFYEGLTAADVEGVTLVIEPKVSPVVPIAFPGRIMVTRDQFLDQLLGPTLTRDVGVLPPGATVAHLAYYLARYLGADPVVLIGQDLGFTDGQYYAAGAAIHDVWACELNQFNSVERMEWERIKRMGAHLRRATDYSGRTVHTDEQLATYLVQFERDFLADTHRGLTIIDATEGGVAKRHTKAETLRGVIDRVLSEPASSSSDANVAHPPERVSVRRAEDRVREVTIGVRRVGDLSRRAATILNEMLTHHDDQRRVSRLIDEVNKLRDEVEAITPAIGLVHYLNQSGAFSRVRADRALQHARSLTPLERQKCEIERDISNVELLAAAADDLATQLHAAATTLASWRNGRPGARSEPSRDTRSSVATEVSTHAVVLVDVDQLRATGPWTIVSTLRQLTSMRRLASIVLITSDVQYVQSVVRDVVASVPIHVRHAAEAGGAPSRMVGAARAPASDCWRSGLGGASIYDEALLPDATLEVMAELGIESVLILRHDWCLLVATICDHIVERASSATGTHRVAFSQAPPGTAGIVVNKAVIADIAKLRRGRSPFSTVGGMLSYVPSAPSLDPIGKKICTPIDAAVRDLGRRFIPDSPARASLIKRAIEEAGDAASLLDVAAIICRIEQEEPLPPSFLTLEVDGVSTAADSVCKVVAELSPFAPDALVTLRVTRPGSDPLRTLVRAARRGGAAWVHVRVEATDSIEPASLVEIEADIVSIEMPDPSDASAWDRAQHWANAVTQCARAVDDSARPRPWIVPRMTKCDRSFELIEGCFDRWLLQGGAAALDPLTTERPGERIAPMPLPRGARARFERTAMYVRADQTVHPFDFFERAIERRESLPVPPGGLMDAWRRVRAVRATPHAYKGIS